MESVLALPGRITTEVLKSVCVIYPSDCRKALEGLNPGKIDKTGIPTVLGSARGNYYLGLGLFTPWKKMKGGSNTQSNWLSSRGAYQ